MLGVSDMLVRHIAIETNQEMQRADRWMHSWKAEVLVLEHDCHSSHMGHKPSPLAVVKQLKVLF